MLEIRPVLPEEHGTVSHLLAGTYVEEGWAEEGYEPVLRDTASRAAAATVLVALLDGEVVGTVTLAVGGPYAEGAAAGEAVIRMLVTSPAARGRGVGRALVQACLDDARAQGCTTVRLSTQEPMTAARALYEDLGFVRTPERDWRPVPELLLLTYALPLAFCAHCGEPGLSHPSDLDPPRFCTRCRRRMVVQVHPTGWTARCVEHGTLSA